jgi:hypothetical protein
MVNVQGDQVPAKQQKMLKKLENSFTKTIAKQSMSSKTPLGSVCQEILTEILNMHRIAANFVPRLLKNNQKPINVCFEL